MAQPDEALGRNLLVRDILDQGAERVNRELADQPDLRAAMLYAIGNAFIELDLRSNAEPLITQAIALQNGPARSSVEDRAETLLALAKIDLRSSRFESAQTHSEQAAQLLEQANLMNTAIYALARLAIADAMSRRNLSVDEVKKIYKESLPVLARFDSAEDLATQKNSYARVLIRAGDPRDAERVAQETLNTPPLPPDHPAVLLTRSWLAASYQSLGRFEDAENERVQLLADMRRVFGPSNVATINTMLTLGGSRIERNNYVGAEQVLRDALTQLDTPGRVSDVDQRIRVLNNLAVAVKLQGRLDEAEQIQSTIGEIVKQHFSADSEYYVGTLWECVEIARLRGDFAQSEQLLRQALDIAQRHLPDWKDDYGSLLLARGQALIALNRGEDAEASIRHGLELRTSLVGHDSPRVLRVMPDLAMAIALQGRASEANALFAKSYASLVKLLGKCDETAKAAWKSWDEVHWRWPAAIDPPPIAECSTPAP